MQYVVLSLIFVTYLADNLVRQFRNADFSKL